jgi:ribonuclease E
MPRTRTRLVRWDQRTPLFSAYDLEPQIDRIYERTVPLPSGGSLVIDRTEALTAVDVNSGRATRAGSQEETAVLTNVEAAREVARQLRLRDIGGLVVVDFIDMRAQKNQRKVEKELREAMKADKARFTVGKISPNGLLEINRQRIQQALLVRTHRACPTCGGLGRIASPEMVGLALVRRIQARAATGSLKSVRIGLHPELADALQNGRRRELADLEEEFEIRIEVVASRHLRRSEQKVEWFDRDPGEERPVRPRPVLVAEPPRAPVLPPPAEEEEEEELEAELEAEASGESGPDGEGAAGNGRRRSRRRRRGRRRGRGGDREAEVSKAAAAPAAASSGNGGDSAPAAGEAGTAKPKRRRRRGGRRRGARGGEVAAAADGEAAGAAGGQPPSAAPPPPETGA